ncbi:MAG TPA: 3-deoxy-manno-octulosonate cytidylyltransferase [Gammaproteobacteria bacterium]|nr:3-deoxy-manno-octulosonate cytidylyltransferase [Gammaproteobacteria bacterium]
MPGGGAEFSVIIPARYGSQRLPGKPLREIAGQPMIRHVYERALESGAAEVIVATDDERVVDAVESFGGTACMTSTTHNSGSERLAEVVARLGYPSERIVVNLQGDEPLMPPSLIRQVAQDLRQHPEAQVSTLCTPIRSAAQLFDPHIVKVVLDAADYALYFSRAPIPWDRETFAETTQRLPERREHLRHIGLYAYRAGYLTQFMALSPAPLERLERLEQLRVLWHGGRIHVAKACTVPAHGVDTPDDLKVVEKEFYNC